MPSFKEVALEIAEELFEVDKTPGDNGWFQRFDENKSFFHHVQDLAPGERHRTLPSVLDRCYCNYPWSLSGSARFTAHLIRTWVVCLGRTALCTEHNIAFALVLRENLTIVLNELQKIEDARTEKKSDLYSYYYPDKIEAVLVTTEMLECEGDPCVLRQDMQRSVMTEKVYLATYLPKVRRALALLETLSTSEKVDYSDT